MSWFPILAWLSQYQLVWLPADLIAGLTVWAVMVPIAMAYAGIAGVHPVIGLYTVPLALVGYAVFGTSRSLVVGPDSATALLSANTIAGLVALSSGDYLTLTASLALLVGVCFLILGFLRMGWVAGFISQPVMKGFIQGLALATIMTQLPKMFGVADGHGVFFQRLGALALQLPNTHLLTLSVGAAGLILLFALPYSFPKVPSGLAVVAASILAAWAFDMHRHGVAAVGAIAAGLPRIGLPHLTLSRLTGLIHGALAIVLLDYTESLGAAKSAALVTGGPIDPNQELIGLGAANIGSGLASGFVVAGSLSQSAVSTDAGGRTQMAALFHAVFILFTLVFLMPLFKNLPEAVLGAIVARAMVKMLDFGYFRKLFVVSREDFFFALAAFLGVLVLGVLPGVGVGVALSLVVLIYHASHPTTAQLGKASGEDVYRNILRRPEVRTIPGLVIFRLDGNLIFANAAHCAGEIRRSIASAPSPVREVLMDAEPINFVDTTAGDMLIRLHAELASRNIGFGLSRVRDPVRELLRRQGVEAALGAENFYDSITEGVDAFHRRYETSEEGHD